MANKKRKCKKNTANKKRKRKKKKKRGKTQTQTPIQKAPKKIKFITDIHISL